MYQQEKRCKRLCLFFHLFTIASFFAPKRLFAKKAAGGETESVLPPAAERRAMERSGAEWNFAKEFYAMVATATGEASPLM